jgi:phospholipid/cholesterol/gamma-HCH transport system substrate-binding protein
MSLAARKSSIRTLHRSERKRPVAIATTGIFAAEDGRKLSAFASDDEQLSTFRALSSDTKELLGLATTAAKGANEIIAHVKSGKGTAGALLMDEALYDDLQELMRDLKHNPWKIMWKE